MKLRQLFPNIHQGLLPITNRPGHIYTLTHLYVDLNILSKQQIHKN